VELLFDAQSLGLLQATDVPQACDVGHQDPPVWLSQGGWYESLIGV